MNYERFTDYKFKLAAQQTIAQADEIIRQYADDGYTLTLRQLYYQFVAKDLIENSDRSYKRLGETVTRARMAGLLPWDGIEDRNRGKKGWLVEESIDEILSDLPYAYNADHWADQDRYIEVWVEKDALGAVVERAVRPYRVGYMACKGYLSASEAYRAGKRMSEAERQRKTPLVLHLGDHDPSGLDMTRDNTDRLTLFNYGPVQVKRLALNMDQIDRYSPPPNPTKVTDSRAEDYIREHGGTSWELDALEPSVIVDLIQTEIKKHIDPEPWSEAQEREVYNRNLLRLVREKWDDVEALLREDE